MHNHLSTLFFRALTNDGCVSQFDGTLVCATNAYESKQLIQVK